MSPAFYSLAAICPSLATQNENIARWQNFWTPARKSNLHQTLDEIGGGLGFRTNAFEPFWKSVDEKPAMLTLDMFRGTALEQALNERVAIGTNDTAVSTLIKLTDRSQAGKLRKPCRASSCIDQKNFADHIASLAKNGMGHFAFWTVVVVGALVYLLACFDRTCHRDVASDRFWIVVDARFDGAFRPADQRDELRFRHLRHRHGRRLQRVSRDEQTG